MLVLGVCLSEAECKRLKASIHWNTGVETRLAVHGLDSSLCNVESPIGPKTFMKEPIK